MSDTMSNPKEQTRHIIVHRRRTPYRRFKHFVTRLTLAFTVSFIIASVIIDALHPRTLNPDAVAALSKLLTSGSSPSPTLLKTANIDPGYHSKHDFATSVIGNPPTLVTTCLLYWTPVESLTILMYPRSPPIIHPALPVKLHFYPLTNVTIFPLGSSLSPIIPRFTPYLIVPPDSASILEHADGFLPARALQSALYSAFVTMHPRVLLDSFVETSILFLGYLETYIFIPQITIPEPLGWARRISKTARERRTKKAKKANQAGTVP